MDWRTFFRWLLGGFFLVAGVTHFEELAVYLPMMPAWLPWPRLLIYASGAAEILGGIGVLVPLMRRTAGWGLIALLLAVLPANLHMALARVQLPGLLLPAWAPWARLPLQLVLIAWVWWTTLAERENPLD